MQLKDKKNFKIGLNKDDAPADLLPGEYTEALNVRTLSSSSQNESGNAETLQSEIELIINPNSLITYYGQSIGGSFVYPGFAEIVVGSQTWMKKNYDGVYPGSKVYDDVEDNADIYGRLYTHVQITQPDFCPAGWRVPTEADIDTLLTYLGGAMIAGGKLKETGLQHWTTPNTGANDLSQFSAMPAGKFDLLFSLLGDNSLLWLQDEAEPVAPVAINGSASESNSFVANWLTVSGITGYYIDVAEDAAFTMFVAGYNNLDVGNVLLKLVNGLNEGTPYYYRVRAYNDVGASENSNTITITTWTIPVADGSGVVNIQVPGKGFAKFYNFPLCHGSILYNGYIYGSARNGGIGVTPMEGGLIVKIKEDDYNDITFLTIRYKDGADPSVINYLEQLQRIGNYLYCIGIANYSDPLDEFDLGIRNILVRIDTTDFTYKIFRITETYQYFAGGPPIIADTTHLYVTTQLRVIQYLASDFDNPVYTQFNTEPYGAAGVPIVPVATIDHTLHGTLSKSFHSGYADATHLYMQFNYAFADTSILLKITKAGMVFVSSVAMPVCSDDMANTATHVFLGVETNDVKYGGSWACVAVRKADLVLTALKKHSTEIANKDSYGVYIYTVGGTDYLFDLRTDGRINILDPTNPDIWDGSAVSDGKTFKLISFTYSDVITHPVSNELILGTGDILHSFLWNAFTEIQKFKIA